MVFDRQAVGLDLGSHFIKVAQVRISGDEALLVRSLVLRREDVRAQGVDLESADEIAQALREALRRAGIRGKGVCLAIDSRESIIRYSHVPPMATKRLDLVMKYEVESVAERAGESMASDYTLLPHRRDGGEEQTVLLAFAKEERLTEIVEALDRVGITVASAVPGALALHAAWDLFGSREAPDSEGDDVVVCVDMGAANFHTALILNDRLVFARSAAFGGDNFTEAVAENLRLPWSEAESFKVARGGVDESLPGVRRESVNALRGVAGQLVSMVQSSVRFCANQAGVSLPAVTRLWVTGGGLRLRGLPEYIAGALGGVPVEVFDPEPSGGTASDNGARGSLGLALGLSALGLRRSGRQSATPSLRILPARYRARREFRERTLFLYCAAGMLAFFLVAQLVHALVRNADADSLKSELSSRLTQLENALTERELGRAESAERRTRINRLLKEAEVTAFQAFVLTLLGEELPPEIQIELIDLELVEVAGGESEYQLLIRGRANNEKRRGLDWIHTLQATLLAEARIRDVELRDTEPEGAWYGFEIAVLPSNQRI
ncbi:MAG: pilus assembly protein PilM [Planctomycetota bacterium]|nr:pilus assembly protein PilM [Planctomycetota bacterium]